MPSILSLFDLKGAQVAAAERLDVHLAVTAGAGSGKTRALVGRYLHFVEQGTPLRSLIAITFTEKAAREMHSRIRREIETWRATSTPPPLEQLPMGEGPGEGVWQTAFLDLDFARIGTIHSLCADLLRLYPAEVGVDPRFTILEEGRAAMLQAEAVESALAWAVNESDVVRLFAVFKENEVRRLLGALLLKRLDAAPLLQPPDPLARWEQALKQWLEARLASAPWAEALAALAEHHSLQADDKLDLARRAVLAHWQTFQTARASSDWEKTFTALRELRGVIATGGLKGNWDPAALEAVREAMKTLRDDYDAQFKPVLKDDCRWELDRQVAGLLPALRHLFERALTEYQSLKDQSLALDFDDLEDLATRLLASPRSADAGLGTRESLRAILVDEFQDTNDRQRQIVYALAGLTPPPPSAHPERSREAAQSKDADGGGLGDAGANLFIVGDSKQSIYRFRGADVTVFRRIQTDLTRLGGQSLDLDLTFRAHAALLNGVERLLNPLMGESDDATRPYRVPFAPLTAYRSQPRSAVRAPFVEFQLGLGEAEVGRRAAAAALAARLRALRAVENFAWEEIAVLCRASMAFPVYEAALEAAGIPFVTVAGQGFYDRPEIRDLLNALTAIADPADDLALAGLLRSPAFAFTDADLYRLRFPNNDSPPQPLFQSLISNPRHRAAAELITRLHALAGRLPLAELLKRFLDATHYRAILKASGSTRLSCNVDKLLADAHRSRLVWVNDFLEYVQALRDVGAREGEAPADPAAGSGSGAVQLMTIHKSKGLEFPLVVIADAGYDHHGSAGAGVQLDSDLGVLLNLKVDDARPVMWQLGALAAEDREAAEDVRLLYVAATRAKEKLIFNGHAKISAAKNDPGRLLLSGWLKQLGNVIGLNAARLDTKSPETPFAPDLASEWAGVLTVTLFPPSAESPIRPALPRVEPEAPAASGPLIASLAEAQSLPAEALESRDRVWRVIASGPSAPAWVVGKLVHEALRRWSFTDLQTRLRPVALEAGLTDEAAIRDALREARHLLERFQAHPLFAEMHGADERYHELPYILGQEAGVIDVLHRASGRWAITDFKTDDVRDDPALQSVLPKYRAQLQRYAQAITKQLNLPTPPQTQLVFLNWQGKVQVIGGEAGSDLFLFHPLHRGI